MANTSYTVFDTKYKKGKYRHNNTDAIHYINKVGKTTNDEFELGIGIDLSDFTMSESDKLQIKNRIKRYYAITEASCLYGLFGKKLR